METGKSDWREGWKGKRCFLLGGGPSLTGFDFSLLQGENTIGINKAYLKHPTLCFIFDLSCMESSFVDPRWIAFPGPTIWLNSEDPSARGRFPGVIQIPECLDRSGAPWRQKWSTSLEEGLWRGTNAGASALNLACLLGADPIFLLGFDMQGGNWHKEYDDRIVRDKSLYAGFCEDFERNANRIHQRVFNLNPASALKTFPFRHLEDVL